MASQSDCCGLMMQAVLPERLASGSDDFTAALWYTEKGEDKGNSPQRLTGHQAAICHLAFSPDSARLATASFDHSIRLWNSKDGRRHLFLIGQYLCPAASSS
uniref:Uncharacterized protein n=1 Tax=Eptatretus burgeri TaxID=7764 RepID=A0A8C4Q0T0_EPTBU